MTGEEGNRYILLAVLGLAAVLYFRSKDGSEPGKPTMINIPQISQQDIPWGLLAGGSGDSPPTSVIVPQLAQTPVIPSSLVLPDLSGVVDTMRSAVERTVTTTFEQTVQKGSTQIVEAAKQGAQAVKDAAEKKVADLLSNTPLVTNPSLGQESKSVGYNIGSTLANNFFDMYRGAWDAGGQVGLDSRKFMEEYKLQLPKIDILPKLEIQTGLGPVPIDTVAEVTKVAGTLLDTVLGPVAFGPQLVADKLFGVKIPKLW